MAVCALALAANRSSGASTGWNDVIGTPGIGFSSLTGPNGAAYSGHTEGDFSILVTAGSWFQSLLYGNPGPSIFAGPVLGPQTGVIQITGPAGGFILGSLDFSSNNGDSVYDIQGYRGSDLVFDETGILAGSFNPFSFNTLSLQNAFEPVDALLIEVIPGPGVTSINLDNIRVSVPEPGSVWVFLAAIVACFARGRKLGSRH